MNCSAVRQTFAVATRLAPRAVGCRQSSPRAPHQRAIKIRSHHLSLAALRRARRQPRTGSRAVCASHLLQRRLAVGPPGHRLRLSTARGGAVKLWSDHGQTVVKLSPRRHSYPTDSRRPHDYLRPAQHRQPARRATTPPKASAWAAHAGSDQSPGLRRRSALMPCLLGGARIPGATQPGETQACGGAGGGRMPVN